MMAAMSKLMPQRVMNEESEEGPGVGDQGWGWGSLLATDDTEGL